MLDGIKALHGRGRKGWKGHSGGIIVGDIACGNKGVQKREGWIEYKSGNSTYK
jgi:hypothetical protein